MTKTKKWDKFETVLLIDTYDKIVCGASREDSLRQLSRLLRQRAINLGERIDDKFRNYNGMSLQLAAIESLFDANRSDRHCAKIFIEMVDLYNSNNEKYLLILAEAYSQAME